MVDKILTAAGIPHRRGRYIDPPGSTYAVYTDDIETDGPDACPSIYFHSFTVELYEPRPDDAKEKALEDAITSAGLNFQKQDRYWLPDEQRYQVVYEFDYIEKRRITNG